MKIGDKFYCKKDYIGTDGNILNVVGKKYMIESFANFHGNEKDVVVSMNTETNVTNVFWLKFQKFNDNWNDYRQNNLFSEYFISEQELRKIKLKKLNESWR